MSKKEESLLEEQIKEAQKLIGVPGKLVGTVSPILNRLNLLGKNGKDIDGEDKKGRIRTLKHNNITWVDVENPTTRETAKLAEIYDFHHFHLENVLLKSLPPQIEKEDKYLFLVLNIPRFDPSENKILTDQISVFLGKNYLVTIHDSAPSVHGQFRLCNLNKDLREAFFKRSSGYLLYLIIGNMVKDAESLIQGISHEIDETEDLVFDVKVSGVHKISQLRQKIIRLRRILGFLKKTFEDLNPVINDVTGDNLSRYYSNLAKIIDKLRDTTGEAIETVEVYKDADYIVSTEKTNQILAVLTIIFTLLLPATLIGTFYGMNILLPGGIETEPWTFWGPYTTLIAVVIGSLIPVILMLVYFKYKKWF